jgi:hypothetical protein
MRQLKKTESGYFTVDEYTHAKIYAALVRDGAGIRKVCLLVYRETATYPWAFIPVEWMNKPHAGKWVARHGAAEVLLACSGTVYEFDTAHEFFTWAAEVTS